MRETKFYCGKNKEGIFVHFYKDRYPLQILGHDKVFEVKVRECIDGEVNTHWAWWNESESIFESVYCSSSRALRGSTLTVTEFLPVIVELL